MSSYEEMWKSFDLCLCLFKKLSKKVADSLGYNYPDYDENVTKYLETQKGISNKYLYGNIMIRQTPIVYYIINVIKCQSLLKLIYNLV